VSVDIEVFGHGVVAQAGLTQPGAEAFVLPVDGFPIQQQRQPVGVSQSGGFRIVEQFAEGLGHALQAQGVELVEGGMGQHQISSVVVG